MNDTDKALESERANRPKRIPLADQKNITTHPEATDPNYKYRIVADYKSKPGRIDKFKKAGWVHVQSGENCGDDAAGKPTKLGRQVSVPIGNGETGYLMKIPKEYYEEDQATKEAKLKEVEMTFNKKKRQEYGEGLVREK